MLTTKKEYEGQQAPYAKMDQTDKAVLVVVVRGYMGRLVWESHTPARRCTTFD
jgi:hypothetical protein